MTLQVLRCGTLRLVPFTLLLSLCVAGCRSRVAAEDQQFQQLFKGFQLVMVDKLSPDTRPEDIDPASLQNTYPAEQTLMPGRVYVFRKITQQSNEELGIHVFPERLRRIGARVTKAPQNSKDLMYVFVGGPLYTIHFEKNGHRGTILNRVHTSKDPKEQWEELIVTYNSN